MSALPSKQSLADREFRMTDRDFRTIAETVYARAGLVVGEQKRELVYSRLARRLRALGISTFAEYVGRLNGPDGSEELGDLVNALTTNHTRFFREPHHFEFLARTCVPYWKDRARKTGENSLRVWSAGCSSGEEPYTIAMTLQSAFGDKPSVDWKILATDIDTNMLARGRAGIYSGNGLDGVDERNRKLYCFPEPDGRVAIAESLRRRVTFNQLNFIDPWPMRRPFDAIFCRNVMIYFDNETKNGLVDRFLQALKPDGWLFLGHSESGLGARPDLKSNGRTIYSKSEGK